MKWLIERLREPSTGIGLAMAAMVARSNPNLAQYADLFDALAYLGGGQAVVAREGGKVCK